MAERLILPVSVEIKELPPSITGEHTEVTFDNGDTFRQTRMEHGADWPPSNVVHVVVGGIEVGLPARPDPYPYHTLYMNSLAQLMLDKLDLTGTIPGFRD